MANLVTALSISPLEDASTGQWPMKMLICGHLCTVSEMRESVPSTGGWGPLTVCAFGSGG